MTNAPIWHDLHILTIEGQDYTDTLSPYDRLPARAARQNPRTCPAPEPIQRPPLRALPDRHPHPPHALNSTQRILWLWSTYPPLASAALISKLAPTTPGAGWQKPVLIASLPAVELIANLPEATPSATAPAAQPYNRSTPTTRYERIALSARGRLTGPRGRRYRQRLAPLPIWVLNARPRRFIRHYRAS